MRKEVLLAVIFGVLLGAIILIGINLANNSVSSLPSSNDTSSTKTVPTPSPAKKSVEIISPQNHAVISEKTISLSGKATPDANLTIITEIDDLIIQSSAEGTFSAQINLIAGENTITVTTLLPDYSTESESITIIQSTTLPE
ncbi:MAG: hypothetical protein UX08_C0025G0011 [Candidatus Collierbacteria bacterium GW2011_GWB1_45_35]|uniref:Polymorphic outer membrane protein n=2 Tax=Candidatus Collieribacteriota TaxID=1752725 RepID=A0A837IHU3_9BACT|nr:MAG: hypothetical protein UW48_C0017G0012 [Microgenomates group bacterium GW2011_GWC1_44_23]KKT94581.1 MAG: hypothetical protein UW96_C0019G0026 [Candidatus Collierbacteria bacterium GW2011_GWA1_45_15]KKT99636.1 MAG: hypothetical protein UX01_C0008G0004 [Candidatus Collierbacteria bacterium GW2011_GWB2_45_17]KKU04470.1 MAG: hypothetical protein UX08_C0025G0011 [Candidatus Collierbacteria bacterium GW2011_GWB1_45_35]KKU07234.1 MAG: hypothetical protein UX11_C0018G0011 [Candidatus Collierbacte